jgi:hypothetical protein
LKAEGRASFLKKRSKKLLIPAGFGPLDAKARRTTFFCTFLFTKSSPCLLLPSGLLRFTRNDGLLCGEGAVFGGGPILAG